MMDCAVILIIDTLLESIRVCFGATEDQINELVCVFFSKLPLRPGGADLLLPQVG